MRFSKSILIGGIAVLAGAKADGWSSSAAPAGTVWSTLVITETLPASTVWSTLVITETPPASTVSIPYTLTSIVDIYETTTITVTSISVSIVTSTATQYSEKDFTYTVSISDDFTTTIYQPTTITDFTTQLTTVTSPTTTTVEQPTTVTLVDSFTVTSTFSIVTCPSRTINPTYTAPTPFPDDYTWGCPPGTICTPTKIDCDFEQNPPADTYYCAPSECVSVGALPNLYSLEASAGTTCGPFPTISTAPFNFNPSYFGLGFTIFECGGDWAQSCSAPSTATTTTTATELETVTLTPATATETDIETVTLTPATATETDIETVTLSPATATETEIEIITVAPATTTSWTSAWSSTGWGRLAKRQGQQNLPAACYQHCDNCLLIAANNGKVPLNCPVNGPFSVAYSNCESCIATSTGGPLAANRVLSSISQFISWCSRNDAAGTAKAKRQVQPTLAMPSPTPESPATVQSTLAMASSKPESLATATPPATTAKSSLARRRPRQAIN
jgi:hypothetical protein